ncbi:MAG: serine/threonine-protein kinase, partial [Candidatus Sulfotelmatobacter sp.]
QKGAGGSGVVYEVLDSEGSAFAIKILDPTKTSSVRLKRFKNEIDFCSRNTHKNIIRVLGTGVIETGETFYVMPLFFCTLRDVMSKGIKPDDILPIFSQILDGVEDAHLHGVWHRDLKPENILCSPSANALVVADFGIAHFEEEELLTAVETKPGERLANFLYAAPEQKIRGKSADSRADVYALGLMLHEMFTGDVPLGTGHKRIADVAPAFAYLDALIDLMRRQSPDERPASIADINGLVQRYEYEAVRLQRLSKINGTVIKSHEIDEPLAEIPPKLVNFEWDRGQLTLILDRPVTSEWVNALRRMGSYSSVMGKPPDVFAFKGDRAVVAAREHEIQLVIDYFKGWLPLASRTLKSLLEQVARKEETRRKEQLRLEREAEEQRLRVLHNIRI